MLNILNLVTKMYRVENKFVTIQRDTNNSFQYPNLPTTPLT